MPSLGDPQPAAVWESRTAQGSVAAVTYVPQEAQAAAPLTTGSRKNGRQSEGMRPCQLRVGAVPNAAGSAYLEQGGTKIMVAIYGPRQAGERNAQAAAEGILNLDLQFSPFSSRFRSRDENEKRTTLYSSMLQRALESVVLLDRYAKTIIDVSIMVLEDDGAAITAALSAASLALADATVETRDIVAGATVHIAKGLEPMLLLDCDADEENRMPQGSAVVHVGLCPARGVICMLHSAGPLPPGPFEQMVLLAKETAEAVGGEIRKCLEQRVEKRGIKRARLGLAPTVGGGASGAIADGADDYLAPDLAA